MMMSSSAEKYVRFIQQGIDIHMIRDNLKLSFEGRAAQHQNTLDMISELEQIGIQNGTRSPSSPQTVDP